VSIRAPIIGKLRLPVHKQGQLPLPLPPAVELASVQWDKITLDHAGGTFRLRLTNRNEFPMDLAALNCGLTLANMQVAKAEIARPLSLPARGGVGEVEIPISFSPKAFGLAAVRMLTSDSSYSLSGNITADTTFGTMRIPFAKDGQIKLKSDGK
jgi:LEA14-like dessication related protein